MGFDSLINAQTPDSTATHDHASHRLTILAALTCEARPWIDAHRLKKVGSKPFDLYRSNEVDLVITGIGAEAMATAVGWIGGQSADARVWLNLGTAGHATRELGEVFLVHGCAASEQGRAHYPPLVAKWNGASEALLSLAKPSSDYPLGAAFDMEAAAFFKAAMRFSASELVQSVKVVSDNQKHGIEHLNATRITELMTPHVEPVNRFTEQMMALALRAVPPTTPVLFSDVRATVSQRLQIEQLVTKLFALASTDELYALSQKPGLSAKHVLSELNNLAACVVPKLAVLKPAKNNHG